MTEVESKIRKQVARVKRTRARSSATTDRPRLMVLRSNRYIYAQIIDVTGKVLAAATSLKSGLKNGAAATAVGKEVAEKALANGVSQVTFDRRGHQYHGNVKALAESAREHGLSF